MITRQDISNPYHNIPYSELCKIARVRQFIKPVVKSFPNGKVLVVEGYKKKV